MADHITTTAGLRGRPGPPAAVAFGVLNGLVLVGVVAQGLTAGAFLGRLAGAGWRDAHQGIAYLTVLIALAAAILASVTLRRRPRILGWSVVLLVLLIVETALGLAIGNGHQRVLLAAHIPIATLIMALGVYLTVAAARLRHAPYQRQTVTNDAAAKIGR